MIRDETERPRALGPVIWVPIKVSYKGNYPKGIAPKPRVSSGEGGGKKNEKHKILGKN